jgi:hypothetical protein
VYQNKASFGKPRGALKKKANAHAHVQNPSKKHSPTSDLGFFLADFIIDFSGVFHQVEFKNTYKHVLNISKMFYKKYEKIYSMSMSFSPFCFLRFFLRNVSMHGVRKHQKFVSRHQKTPTHLRGRFFFSVLVPLAP